MILRVFPRRTNATPTDEYAVVGYPGLFVPPCDEIHVSVTFTWDLPLAEKLVKAWEPYGPVKLGGPATGMRGEEFVPGRYVKPGYVITSRGCPNRCWFCSVPKREGDIRELPITDGWNVLDDNILACSSLHFGRVCAALGYQKRHLEFTGGLEAARLTDQHIDWLVKVKPKQMFFAYDTPSDREPLRQAAARMLAAGFTRASHALRCFVLVGYRGDTFDKAEARLREAAEMGYTPMAMLWRGEDGKRDPAWRTFQRHWARPASVSAQTREPR